MNNPLSDQEVQEQLDRRQKKSMETKNHPPFSTDKKTGIISKILRVLTLHPRSGWIYKEDQSYNWPWLLLLGAGVLITAGCLVANVAFTYLIFTANMQCAEQAGHTETCVELWLYGVDQNVDRENVLLRISDSDAREARYAIGLLVSCASGYFLLVLVKFVLPGMSNIPVLSVIANLFGFKPDSTEERGSIRNMINTETGKGPYLAFWVMFVIFVLTWTAWYLLHGIKLKDEGGFITFNDGVGYTYIDIMAAFTVYPLLRFSVTLLIHSPKLAFISSKYNKYGTPEELHTFVPDKSLSRTSTLHRVA